MMTDTTHTSTSTTTEATEVISTSTKTSRILLSDWLLMDHPLIDDYLSLSSSSSSCCCCSHKKHKHGQHRHHCDNTADNDFDYYWMIFLPRIQIMKSIVEKVADAVLNVDTTVDVLNLLKTDSIYIIIANRQQQQQQKQPQKEQQDDDEEEAGDVGNPPYTYTTSLINDVVDIEFLVVTDNQDSTTKKLLPPTPKKKNMNMMKSSGLVLRHLLHSEDDDGNTKNKNNKMMDMAMPDLYYQLGCLFKEILIINNNNNNNPNNNIPRPLMQLVEDLMMIQQPQPTTTTTTNNNNAVVAFQSIYEVLDDLNQMLESLSSTSSSITTTKQHYHYQNFFYLSDQIVNFTKEIDIPSKLYGRTKEIDQLVSAIKRVKSYSSSFSSENENENSHYAEIVLVTGHSGCGKSCLVKETMMSEQNNENDDGYYYFISGKFDQMRSYQPYSAIIYAFTELCDQILSLEDPKQIKFIRSKIRAAIGSQGKVLTELIPKLERIIGIQQDELIELSGSNESRNRFHYVFRKFVHSISSPNKPLILFLDDLQWADESSLDLIKTLMTDVHRPSLLVVGAYRTHNNNNEINTTTDDDTTHHYPLSNQMMQELVNKQVPITKIKVRDLSKCDLNRMISDLLQQPQRKTKSLADAVFQKTDGNPLFAIRFLKHLRDSDLLTYNTIRRRWEWDIVEIDSKMIAQSIVDLLATKIRSLPSETQDMLKMAAGIGSYFDEYTLKLIFRSALFDRNDVLARSTFNGLSTTLRMASAEGLIKPCGEMGYRFVHDKIQQAAYSLIPVQDRPFLHLSIGRLLSQNGQGRQRRRDDYVSEEGPPSSSLRSSSSSGNSNSNSNSNSNNGRLSATPKMWAQVSLEDMNRFAERMLFVAADQLNRGSECMSTRGERERLIQLNLRAAQRAISSSAFAQAEQYLESGRNLLGTSKWDEYYEESIEFYSMQSETMYCNGNYEGAEQLFEEVDRHATTILDKLRTHSVRVKSLGARSDFQKAIDAGFDFLDTLGEPFPQKVNNWMILQILRDMLKTKRMLLGKTGSMLRNLPEMKDPLKMAAMQVLCEMLSYTYMCRPEYVPLVAGRLMQSTLRHGASSESGFAFSTYALILSGVLNDYKRGYEFAQLALFFVERFQSKKWVAHVYGVVYSCCIHWQRHSRNCIEPLEHGHRVGMSTGDIEYAMWCAYFALKHKYFCGQQLCVIEEEMRGFVRLMQNQGQEAPLASLSTYWQAVLNLLGRSANATVLSGEAMDQNEVVEVATKANNSFLLQCVYLHRLWLGYIHGDYDLAAEMAENSRNIKEISPGVFEVIEHAFYDGLASAKLLQIHPGEGKWRKQALKASKKMKKWAKETPENCMHKHLLLEAEINNAKNRPKHRSKTLQLYKSAIAYAKNSGYRQDEAISYERLADFHLKYGDTHSAADCCGQAQKLYSLWGAELKSTQLQSRLVSISKSSFSISTVENSTNFMFGTKTNMNGVCMGPKKAFRSLQQISK